MHYKNGREAKVGDEVIGTTYNRKGVQVGILVGITPGTETCNARVAILEVRTPYESNGISGMIHTESASGSDAVLATLISSVIDYSACSDLLHADDAAANSVATVRKEDGSVVEKHDVVRTDACYVCTKCGEAHGDGDGFVGEACIGCREISKDKVRQVSDAQIRFIEDFASRVGKNGVPPGTNDVGFQNWFNNLYPEYLKDIKQ